MTKHRVVRRGVDVCASSGLSTQNIQGHEQSILVEASEPYIQKFNVFVLNMLK